jgi:hypothetical protein
MRFFLSISSSFLDEKESGKNRVDHVEHLDNTMRIPSTKMQSRSLDTITLVLTGAPYLIDAFITFAISYNGDMLNESG